MSLFPNPAADRLYIQLSGITRKQIECISIFNTLGGLVVTTLLSEQKNKDEIVIDTRHLPRGIYFVELTLVENKLRKKFVKE